MIDILFIAKICGAVMGIIAFLLYLAKVHRDLFIVPWIRRELEPMKAEVSIVARLMREKYREEYQQAEEEVDRESKLRGVSR